MVDVLQLEPETRTASYESSKARARPEPRLRAIALRRAMFAAGEQVASRSRQIDLRRRIFGDCSDGTMAIGGQRVLDAAGSQIDKYDPSKFVTATWT